MGTVTGNCPMTRGCLLVLAKLKSGVPLEVTTTLRFRGKVIGADTLRLLKVLGALGLAELVEQRRGVASHIEVWKATPQGLAVVDLRYDDHFNQSRDRGTGESDSPPVVDALSEKQARRRARAAQRRAHRKRLLRG